MPVLWCVTDYVKNIEFWKGLYDTGKITYFGYSDEICPSTKRPHWQAFCKTDRKSFNAMKKMVNPRHVEPMGGSLKSNRVYCTKESQMKHMGVAPTNGNSNCVLSVKRLLDEGEPIETLYDEGFQLGAIRWGERYRALKRRRTEFVKPEVVWIHGPTGSGKSRYAFEYKDGVYDEEDTWVSSDDFKFFEGYCGQRKVIFDDFRGSDCRFSWLLRLLDGYRLKVQVKGGSANWCPELIIITSSMTPVEAYHGCTEQIDQLTRRIDTIMEKLCVPPQGNTVPGGVANEWPEETENFDSELFED